MAKLLLESKTFLLCTTYVLLLIYTILDAYHTYEWLSLGIPELNPVVKPMIEYYGPLLALYGFKLLTVGTLGFAIFLVLRRSKC